MLVEVNIDALVGPTHHFGGLGVGNEASREHRMQASNPKQAALQGLEKAALIASLGIPQFLWLPPVRPNLDLLSQLGFNGSVSDQLQAAAQLAPSALSAVFSSAFMWAANSATVSPAADCRDGRYHFTPANLISSWHRATEAIDRRQDLAHMFSVHGYHEIHEPLPSIVPLRDEGAANHMRLCNDSGEIGFNIFVFGEREASRRPQRYLARQTLEASQAIARRHGLDPRSTFFLQQHPDAIDAGVFHNDVIATSHRGLLIHHELAFWEADTELARLEAAFVQRTGRRLIRRVVAISEMTLEDAVRSYVFNCQIVTDRSRAAGLEEWAIICPDQCSKIPSASKLVNALVVDSAVPISAARYVALEESMRGGGGPACLRLRVDADKTTLAQLPLEFRLTESRLDRLREVIQSWYPERLTIDELTSMDFVEHLARTDQALVEALYGQT